ncbi:MAG: isoprenylcysteine carboxylmethyltransferase family protein [Clostridia bacterium]|nr:isoprenylcysteine carboxylmethyltransferase family protein [Clostridia bacterium]
MKLLCHALMKFFAGLILLGLLLFLPAGTLAYPGAWRFLALLFVPMLILGAVLLIKAPALLEKRLNTKEKEGAQQGILAVSGLLFLAAFILAGLDFRFGWSHMPVWLTASASIVLLAAYAMYAEVMRENVYLSRTVEVQDGQHVIDTGLYGIVRHPMYTATIFLFLAIPLVLGSWPAFAVMLFFPVTIIFRIRNEERVLEEGLDGYRAYKQKVKYRLIPFVW